MRAGRILRVLGSWWTTTAILLVLAGLFISCTFGEEAYAAWSRLLYHTPAGVGLQFALILNLLLASLRIAADRLGRRPPSADDIRAMDVSAELPLSAGYNLDELAVWLKGRGFTGTPGADTLQASRGRLSFLPGTLLRCGLIVLMGALLLSAYARTTLELTLHEGETVSFAGTAVTLGSITSHIPDTFFQAGEAGTFNLENVSAVLQAAGTSHRISAGLPVRIRDRYYRISDLGYAHRVGLETAGEKTEKQLDLKVLPPGKTDTAAFPPHDLFLTFTLQPEKTITKGLLAGKQFSLARPLYLINLQEGREKNKKGTVTLKPEEKGSAGNVQITLGKTSLYIRVQSVSDPALLWIYAGFLLVLTGLAALLSRFLWYEQQFAAVICGQTILIGYREEFFKKWGIQKFSLWLEKMLGEEAAAAALKIRP